MQWLKIRKNSLRVWKLGAALAAATMTQWGSKACEKCKGQNPGPQPCTWEEQTLACPGICFEESQQNTVLKRRGIQETSRFSRTTSCKLKNCPSLQARIQAKGDKRYVEIKKVLLTKARHKNEACKSWKQGQMTQKNPDIARICKDSVRKANLVLNLVRDRKGNKKGFYRYSSSKKKKTMGKCRPAEWSRGSSGKGHRRGRGAQDLPHFCLYW